MLNNAEVRRPDHPWFQVGAFADDVLLDPLHPSIGIGAGGSIVLVLSLLRNADVEDPGIPSDVRRPSLMSLPLSSSSHHTVVVPLLLLLLLEMLRLVVLPPGRTLVDEWLRCVLGCRCR